MNNQDLDFFKQWQLYHYRQRLNEATDEKEKSFLRKTLKELSNESTATNPLLPYQYVHPITTNYGNLFP